MAALFCALKEMAMVRKFDWHGGRITLATVITEMQ
jgi:hypothetical protein